MPSSISSRVSGLRKAITNTARKVKKKLKSAVVVVAIEYREVVNSLTSDRLLNLRDCEISDSEWNIIDDTVYALKVFKDATILFSADSKSTIAHVITTMDKIDHLVTTTIVPARRERVLHQSIRDALKLAKKTMNLY
ncbi:hypothetical protein C8J57DRAFT_1533994 [Mycena rebaudengoi]|nr:hypothetical protein C8J57DRAFT_1533994 [Mycena rebaudengoi]